VSTRYQDLKFLTTAKSASLPNHLSNSEDLRHGMGRAISDTSGPGTGLGVGLALWGTNGAPRRAFT